MKVIANNLKRNVVLVEMSEDEWLTLQLACDTPYDKRSKEPGTEANGNVVYATCDALRGVKELRGKMGEVQKKWDTLATRLDTLLEK